jgi:hypothetical protein
MPFGWRVGPGDHLRVRRPPVSRELPEQVLLNAPHDPADHAVVVFALDAAHISRQVRSNPSPLLIAQPKQILTHDPDPSKKRIKIVLSGLKN